jgi:predicted kinase
MQLIEEALQRGLSVIVDNTNPTPEDRAPILALARRYGAETVGFAFDSPIDDCLARNASRSGRERVPDRALHITAGRLQPPTREEGFDRLYRVGLAPGGGFAVEELGEGGEG